MFHFHCSLPTVHSYVHHAAGLWPAMYIAEHIRKCHTHGLT